MTKIEFLQQLYNLLGVLPAEERDDIIADFEETSPSARARVKARSRFARSSVTPKAAPRNILMTSRKKPTPYTAQKKTAIRDMKPRRPM